MFLMQNNTSYPDRESIKVSVIIPVYNTEKYLRETLSSIMEQNLSEIEILVVDDGSTDNSYQILKSIASTDKRIHIYKQENKGQGAARNLGMKYAQGEYVYFMDSDDLLLKDALLQCYNKCKDKDLDFLFFDAQVFGLEDTSIKFNYSRTHLINDEIYPGLVILKKLMDVKGYQVPVWLNFINLSFLSKVSLSFYEDIHHEDQLFTFLLFVYAQRVGKMDKAFFKRRLRPNSTMTSKFSRSNAESYFTIASRLIELKRQMNNPLLNSLVDRLLTSMMNDVLYSARSMNRNDRAFVLSYSLKYYWKYSHLKNILLISFPPLATLKTKSKD